MRNPSWPPMLVDHLFECGFCGEYFAPRIADDAAYVDKPCQHSDRISTVITLNVPSGKNIVTDDLRPVFSVERNNLASYNSTLGQAQYIEAMAVIGCAYGPTCLDEVYVQAQADPPEPLVVNHRGQVRPRPRFHGVHQGGGGRAP
ncbi:hypothetical protein [Streptomyces spongiae]|uniref:Uncharacterized protein n=1 Tax=Streptomyces spongiae TaxID=565072 RepID=A0A5N8XMI0_9ACTN|nr:hypothetical protein [Streptomyces spongiae]MPY60577.1 hypothetical protein [Streptomyces spongiae]